jgi:hypothetical protein
VRPKVREIDPQGGGGRIEEVTVEAPAELSDAAEGPEPGGAAIEEVAGHAPPTAADLGPNGEAVHGLLHQVERLTGAQCHALEEEAGWRWWSLNPLVGTTMPAARARALVLGRREGRADAIVAMDAAVHTVLFRGDGAKAHGSRLLTCVSNAGLAVLVRDLIEPETFETLFGPWGAVMHH